ncbi:sialin [Caerostris extrusa]|uniref:Sialin n=1 Tax=Caerostris extrusa TaxID=172846 RepID=A0AAV4P001_CAEEX|nr:sialin [Caerostris extrusa]
MIPKISDGAAVTSINTLIVKWMPLLERNSHYSIIYNGIPLGIVFSFAVDYFITENDYFGGWTSLFYIEAAISVVWFLFWSILIFEAPEDHKFLSETEVEKIRSAQGKDVKNLTTLSGVPWRKMITSPAVWALAAANSGVRWSYETLFLELPIYMGTVLNYYFMDNRLRSSMPFISGAVIGFTFGYLADNLRSKGRYSITTIRKTFNCFVVFIEAKNAGSGIAHIDMCPELSGKHAFRFLTVVFIEAKNAGSGIAHIDMCPELSGKHAFRFLTVVFIEAKNAGSGIAHIDMCPELSGKHAFRFLTVVFIEAKNAGSGIAHIDMCPELSGKHAFRFLTVVFIEAKNAGSGIAHIDMCPELSGKHAFRFLTVVFIEAKNAGSGIAHIDMCPELSGKHAFRFLTVVFIEAKNAGSGIAHIDMCPELSGKHAFRFLIRS